MEKGAVSLLTVDNNIENGVYNSLTTPSYAQPEANSP
jgi:hypothetical protein